MSLPPEQLSAFLQAAGQGDERAFAELYRLTAAKLFGVALRILQRRDWAEDVLQECYVNIWRHARDYDADKSQPMTWMTSVVRHRCLDWLRRPHAEVSTEEMDTLAEWADPSSAPLERLLATRDAAALAHCLRTLEGKQRQSIALTFYHGLSHQEVAARMSVPLGTVKSWVRRGMDSLKGCLSL